MNKFLAASILGLAALSQSAAAAPGQQTRSFQQPMAHKIMVQKIGVARPMFQAPMMHKPIIVKPILAQPLMHKPVMHQPIMFKPAYVKPIVVGQPYHYNAGYKPMYRYYPLATYGYESAPKACVLMLHKSHYGMVNKVWRCTLIEKVEIAPIKAYAAPATVIEKVEPAPTKIIERTIERHTIEKQIPVVPTDDTLPPK